MKARRNPGSFRDPDGFVFVRAGTLLRQIHASYAKDWTHLHDSGLYDTLASRGHLVSHQDRPITDGYDDHAWRVIAPQVIPWVSHPYEWTPAQLQSAAILTLEVQAEALEHGMELKDASAWNIQFLGSRPVFVDSLSFTVRAERAPWPAYQQFCRQFLGPLALMHYGDPRLRDLLRTSIEGPELDLVSRLLPRRTWLNPALLTHLHLHAKSVSRNAGKPVPSSLNHHGVSLDGARGLVAHLRGAVKQFARRPAATTWSAYESSHNYDDDALRFKQTMVEVLATRLQPRLTFDLGANTGRFSDIVASSGGYVVAIDSDLGAVDSCWRRQLAAGRENILPLWMDLSNPSPSQGWAHTERASLAERGPADLVLALALVHHVVIGHNIPLPAFTAYLASLGSWLLLEWIPKEDPQVQRLLLARPDIFVGYDEAGLLEALKPHWTIQARDAIPGTRRLLFTLAKR